MTAVEENEPAPRFEEEPFAEFDRSVPTMPPVRKWTSVLIKIAGTFFALLSFAVYALLFVGL